LGTTQYQGDLSQDQITINETKPSVGILGRYYLNPRVDIKASIYLGWISGTDSNYANDHYRYKRNLSFNSVVIDASGVLEYNILPYISNSKKYRFAPVLFAGVSLFYFNPMAHPAGNLNENVALQPLGTEGQFISGGGFPAPYSRLQVSIPMGIAFKYSLGNFWNLGLEVGLHKTFTDYLDDVSNTYGTYDKLTHEGQEFSNRTGEKVPGYNPAGTGGQKRGNPDRMDTYIFAGFTLTKTIRRWSCTGF